MHDYIRWSRSYDSDTSVLKTKKQFRWWHLVPFSNAIVQKFVCSEIFGSIHSTAKVQTAIYEHHCKPIETNTSILASIPKFHSLVLKSKVVLLVLNYTRNKIRNLFQGMSNRQVYVCILISHCYYYCILLDVSEALWTIAFRKSNMQSFTLEFAYCCSEVY